MEEVDKIIIDSIKYLNCDFGEVDSLKQFDTDMVVNAISACLEMINPNLELPKKLPPSMSLRLNIASNLAQLIKGVGFRGDLGYQTILYHNEFEIRRILMFLVERLPKDTSKTVQTDLTGYVPRIVKKIEDTIKDALCHMWLPTSVLSHGVRECASGNIVNSFGNSVPLQCEILRIPDSTSSNEVLRDYWNINTPEVTRQCSPRKLIPSLLFRDSEFTPDSTLRQCLEKSVEYTNVEDVHKNMSSVSHADIIKEEHRVPGFEQISRNKELIESKAKILLSDLELDKTRYTSLQDAVKNCDLQLSQLRTMKNDEQELLKDSLSKVKVKTKTLAIINKEENKAKLKALIESTSNRLVELANQWNEVQTPLLGEYKSLKSTISSEELKLQEEQIKFHALLETRQNLTADLKDKTILEQNLIEKCRQISKNNNRSVYTRRILEIVGNIKKQNNEIQKVLKDTRIVQKDINNLTGQVDRSFTLADELIFYDAKQDEVARRAYKFLAILRDECSNILKAVTELGQVEREARNLQEQVETEKNKETNVKLERVYSDLKQIQTEIESMKP